MTRFFKNNYFAKHFLAMFATMLAPFYMNHLSIMQDNGGGGSNSKKFGAEEVTDPEQFAALLNKQFAKYNEILSNSATKSEIKQMQADLIVENKDILSKVTANGDEMQKLVKQLESFTETIKIQGETITKMKTAFIGNESKPRLGDTIVKMITKDGVFNDFIAGKTSTQRFEIQTKDVAFGGTYGSGAAGQSAMPFQVPQMPPMENFDVRLILPTGSVDSTSLKFPQERAASLTDATASKAENASLAESTMGFTMAEVTAHRIGAFIEVSRTALRNSSWLSNYINNRLMAMLIKNLNTQIIAATGSGTDVNGLYNNANAFDPATNFTAVTQNPTNADVIRAAIAEMNSSYFINANSAFLNPIDAAIAAISKTTIGEYIDPKSFLSPNVLGYSSQWGLRNIESANITKDTFLIAAVQAAYMELLFNGPIEVIATDSHASQFIDDIVTIKIQVHAMLPIYNANALMKGTFSTAKATMLIS